MKRCLCALGLAVFAALAAGEGRAQPQCGALIEPQCLSKFGAGAEIAPASDCGEQLTDYRNCVAGAAAIAPSEPRSDDALDTKEGVADLRGLLTAAIHHYDRYAGRFEHRVTTGGARTPDLINIYESKGIIYFYGKRGLDRRAAVKRLKRSQVAKEYMKIMERVFSEHEFWRDRRGAYQDAASRL